MDDIIIKKAVDNEYKCDWIIIEYSFKSINDYNTKTQKMAKAYGHNIEYAKIDVDGNELTFTENKKNLQKSIDWALDAIYNDPEIFVQGTGNSMHQFAVIHGSDIKVGETMKSYDYKYKYDEVPDYITVTGNVKKGEELSDDPTPEELPPEETSPVETSPEEPTPIETPDVTPGEFTPVPVPSPASDWVQVEPFKGDYTIVVMPDTQYYADQNPLVHDVMSRWIAENAEKENIKFVIHTGDFTNWNSDREWANASKSMSIMDGIVPYAPLLGNHDYPGFFTANRDTSQFNKYFPLSKFENRPEFGGVFEEGKLDNAYYIFNAEGTDFILLALEFAPRDETVEWANQVIADHPNHKAIVVTHTYLNHDGKLVGKNTLHTPNGYLIAKDPNETVNNGEDLWEKLIKKHENIYMVVSGHIPGSYDVVTNLSTGDNGNKVLSILVDPQGFGNGGQGLILLMRFSENNQKISFNYYSPYHDAYYKYKNQFTFNLLDGQIEIPVEKPETPPETPDETHDEAPDETHDESPDETPGESPVETPGTIDEDIDNSPKTGDHYALYGLMLIISAAVMLLIRRRNKYFSKWYI